MTDRQTSFGIVISVGNSTRAPLGAGESFVGETESVLSYEEIDVNLYGVPAVASGEFYFEFSPDGTHWDVSVLVTGGMLSGPQVLPPQYLRVILPFFRVRYVNGVTPLTELRLTTVYHRSTSQRLTRYLNQEINDTEGVLITRSIAAYRDADGTYKNVSQTEPLPIAAGSLPLPTGAATSAKQDALIANLQALNSLVPSSYDYVSLGYTGSDLTTVLFKLGGSSGAVVSTLTLTYSNGNLVSVTRS